MKKIKALDCFAGIAVMLVVMVHTYQQIDGLSLITQNIASYGRLGTQLFFVLSGFKITMSLYRDHSIKRFYYKRYLNVALPYYIAIVFWAFLTCVCPLRNGIGWTQNKNPFAIVSNVLLLNGVFVEGNNDVVPGGWYIGTTVLFYIIAPALIRILNYIKEKSIYILFVVPFFAFYIGRIVMVLLAPIGDVVNIDYTSLFEQLPCIIVGCVLFYLYDEKFFEKKIKRNISVAIVVIIGLKILHFPIIEMIDTVFAVSLLYGIIYMFFYESVFIDTRVGQVLQKMGRLSYEMYFVHFVFAWYIIPYTQRWLLQNIDGNMFFVVSYILNCVISYKISKLFARGLAIIRHKIDFISKQRRMLMKS